LQAVNIGDVTQINDVINDLDSAYLFLPLADAGQQQPWQQQPWQGGVNLTALALLEARAYGSYHFFRNHTPGNLTVGARDLLSLDYEAAASRHGLSKFVYLRDTRRAVGHNNFRLNHTAMVYANASRPGTGYEFADSEPGVHAVRVTT
jgi:hypothetical protein